MKPDFSKSELIPAIIQDANTKDVLMLGYMNEEALALTEQTKRVTFFSRSKNRLWTKGESSGNFLNVLDIKLDCDKDTILITAAPVGPACHTGTATCFGETESEKQKIDFSFLSELTQTIKARKNSPSDSSYTSSLFASGINRISQKVGEEAVELVIASKDSNAKRFVEEAADLLFHYLVLLEEKELSLQDVMSELQARNKKRSS